MDVHQLHPGHACRANGFFALTTAQAVDCAVLSIVLVTLLAIIRLVHLPDLSGWWIKLLVCSSTWAVPLVTSLTALAMDALGPVDTNWCDITVRRPGLRYALERGWRLAIMLLAICLYAFVWWLVRRRRCSFSATISVKVPRGLHLCNRNNDAASITTAPSRFSAAQSSLQTASRPFQHLKEAGCSEVSLPLQGSDFPDVEIHERESIIDSRRVSRWTNVRPPGMIDSTSTDQYQSQSRLLNPRTSPNPPVTRPFTVTTDFKSPAQLFALFPPTSPPSNTRPNYHNQCPKVRKSFEVSTEEGPEIATISLIQEKQISVPHTHKSAKSVNSVGAQTKSSLETVPWRIRSAGQLTTLEVKTPFFDASSSPVRSSTRTSASASSKGYAVFGSRPHHSHCPKVMESLETCINHRDKSPGCQPALHLERSQDSRQWRNDKDPLPQENPSQDGHEEGQGYSGLSCVNDLPFEYPFQRPITHMQGKAASKPGYHNQCPKVRQTFELSVDTRQETGTGPNYHNQCPKVTRTVSIVPSGSSTPKPPPLILRPDVWSTKTTIATAPGEAPPSPTPGLPPPPWSSKIKQQRRKTFLLSRSTWSDSTVSQEPPFNNDETKNEREIHLTLLLNAYPVAYFILLLPWMVNCFMEVEGDMPQDWRAMHVLLGLPQYLGLVNAMIFAVNEYLQATRRKARNPEPGRVNDEKGSLGAKAGGV